MLKLTIIACGNKMPAWVNEAAFDYCKRLKEFVTLHLIEIPLQKRSKSSDLARIMEKEAVLINAAIPSGSYVIALEIDGECFSSEKLASKLESLQQHTSHLCLLIGGPEGLSPASLSRCRARWSLSSLTLPHPLVRIILLEALYRAWSIMNNHPYHK